MHELRQDSQLLSVDGHSNIHGSVSSPAQEQHRAVAHHMSHHHVEMEKEMVQKPVIRMTSSIRMAGILSTDVARHVPSESHVPSMTSLSVI